MLSPFMLAFVSTIHTWNIALIHFLVEGLGNSFYRNTFHLMSQLTTMGLIPITLGILTPGHILNFVLLSNKLSKSLQSKQVLFIISQSYGNFRIAEVCSLLGVSQVKVKMLDRLGSYLEASRNHSCKTMQMAERTQKFATRTQRSSFHLGTMLYFSRTPSLSWGYSSEAWCLPGIYKALGSISILKNKESPTFFVICIPHLQIQQCFCSSSYLLLANFCQEPD